MAALALVLLITVATYHWAAAPLIALGTASLQAGWVIWVPVLVLAGLLAGRD